MIAEEEGDEIEIADARRHRIVERPDVGDDILHRRMLHPLVHIGLGGGAHVRGVLRIDDAVRRGTPGHQLGAVSRTGRHVDHLPSRQHARESQELHGLAPSVILAVGIGSVRRGNDGGIVRRRRVGAGGGDQSDGEHA